MAKRYAYTREHHFRNCLERYAGKESDPIPDHIIDEVVAQLAIEKVSLATGQDIKSALRKLRYPQYYDYRNVILDRITSYAKALPVEHEECPVCLEEISSMIALDCKHMFCETCVHKLDNNHSIKCPLCRREQQVILDNRLTEEQLEILRDDYIRYKESLHGQRHGPFENVIEQLIRARGWKTRI